MQSGRAVSYENSNCADYIMAFDLMGDLAGAGDEEEVVSLLLDFFAIICAPEKVCYVSVIDGCPGDIFLQVPPDGSGEEKSRLCSMEKDLVEHEDGFTLRIGNGDEIVGIIDLQALRFPEYKDHYMNLAVHLRGVLALGITNARQKQELKSTATQLRSSLHEKEMLLRELYHRTKNNMQVISSLLNLQSAQLKDRGMIQIFNDTRNRIRAMSLVHEKLYQSQDLSFVDLNQYARDLAMTILKSYRTGDSRITLEFDIAFIPLSIETITPLGLIINELLSNALKYAFPADQQGTIRISARACGKGDIEFLFSDNGIGLPVGFDPHQTDSLGMQLIYSLAETQLCGRLEVSPCKGGGTEFGIWFNDLRN